MISNFVEIKRVNSKRSTELLEKITNNFSRHINSKLLDLQTSLDEDLLCIKKNANVIVQLKDRKKELDQIVQKIKLFESIVQTLQSLQTRGRITWGFYKENVYDLIENYNSLNSSKLQNYLEKIRKF